MSKFISLNIKHLINKENLTQREFADMFSLQPSVVNSYVNNKSTPKIDTIIEICKHFDVSLDFFLYAELSQLKTNVYPSMQEALQMQVNEAAGIYGEGPIVESLREIIAAKDEIIKMLREENARLKGQDRSKTD